MNNSYFFKDSKGYPGDSDLQSLVIDSLRCPLAVTVVFIHSFGSKELDLVSLHSNPFSAESAYDFLRIALSNIGTHFAVPVFFMFSGFLFFYKVKNFSLSVYKGKLQKRFRSLFVPYVCWIVLAILKDEAGKVAGVIVKGKPVSSLWQYFVDNGGLHMFWDNRVWGSNYQNWLGWAVPGSGPTLVPLWFLRDLMVVILFAPIIYHLVKRFKVVPVVVMLFCYISGIWIPFPGFTATTFFWFTLGAYFSIRQVNMIDVIYRWRIPSYIVSVLTLLPLVWLNGRKGDGVTTDAVGQALYPFYVIAAALSVVCIAKRLVERGKVRIYPHLAKASFFVFLCHVFVLGYVGNIIDKCIPIGDCAVAMLKYLAAPMATTFVCLGFYRILDKFFPRLLSVLTGSRS